MTRPIANGQKLIRCAIYTRKSTEEGLDQSFNSLDAQRESGEAFIKSQAREGWVCLTDRYDDGGFTGGNMDRPALKRLLADIDSGRVDCVVVYKVDRLSRSLLDFAKIMDVLDRRGASFVSVTQAFNTTSSMGRLTLNVLLSFAQFEREIISERTRDKMAAARRRGKYVGGAPILGYDIDRPASRLVVNEREAEQVRQIFGMYLKHEAMIPTIEAIDELGWTTKRWITANGKVRGGVAFTKSLLHGLLTNATYIGKIQYKDQIYAGEHPGIVDPATFDRVQKQLRQNHRTGGREVRNRFGALLKGLLHCVPCGCRMTHTHTTRGTKRYRYYTCQNAQKRGWSNCPSKAIPAGEIEKYVVEQIRAVGRDPAVVATTLAQVRGQAEESIERLAAERAAIERDLVRNNASLRQLVGTTGHEGATARLAELHEQLRVGEQRLTEIREETIQLQAGRVDETDVTMALAQFDPIWGALSLKEQARVLRLLIERVDYDGDEGTVSVTFRPTGIRTLAQENTREETAA